MYQIFGVKNMLAWFTTLCGAILLIRVWFLGYKFDGSMADGWKLISSSIAYGTLLVFVVGQTKLFSYLCRAPLIKSFFPPIDGIWEAELNSNWTKIQELQGQSPAHSAKPLMAQVTINSTLFFVRINLTSADRYSRSKTIHVTVSRDAQDSSVQLNYMYINETDVPLPTDSPTHNGAARLNVHNEGPEIWMDGTYWTDRKWSEGLNTAGRITLRRKVALSGS
ncbi:hypothetical protein ABIE16_002417 [Pseudomonas sp. 2725]|jgi:hypothetical protein|uniref:Cap15 family cyclic dinucleotide receptor domain-containing protein n=1 Tax=Pseudomonas sp. 2725 TaxID=3156449 RepID=UPI003D238313